MVIDFPGVVASRFRQNFDQIESILYLFLYFILKHVLFKVLISIVFYKMSQSVVDEISSIYSCNYLLHAGSGPGL